MKSEFLAEKFHKWLSIIIGVQAVLWLVSGLYMVIVNIDYIHGDHLVRPIERSLPSASEIKVTLEDLSNEYENIKTISLKTLGSTPYYQLRTNDDQFLVNARTGEKLTLVSEEAIRVQAEAIYASDGTINKVELLTQGPQEMQNRKVALWRVDFEDTVNTSFYFNPKTGELISRRHTLWRAFDFLWMLHIMDYDTRDDITTTLFRTAAIIGLLSFIAGLWFTYYRITKPTKQEDAPLTTGSKRGPMPLMRTIHKWVGLVVGIQIVIWTVSAIIMSFMGHQSDHHLTDGLPTSVIADHQNIMDPQDLMAKIEGPKLDRLRLTFMLDQYIYEAQSNNGTFLFNASTGAPVTVSADLAKKIAVEDYSGTGPADEPIYLETTPYAARGHVGPVWKIHFADVGNPTFYLSAASGRVLERRDDTWETFDFWWMLHMMDFAKEGSFNNAIIIGFSLISLFIGLTGFILLFDCFNKESFNFKRKWNNFRAKSLTVIVQKADGGEVSLMMKPGTVLFEGLANAGFDLPSNCGGQGDCGLCRVEFIEGAVEPTESELKVVPRRRREKGFRLACQNIIRAPIKIALK